MRVPCGERAHSARRGNHYEPGTVARVEAFIVIRKGKDADLGLECEGASGVAVQRKTWWSTVMPLSLNVNTFSGFLSCYAPICTRYFSKWSEEFHK
jgi:hypothetical protein